MKFRKVLALRGPNMWARFPVLEAWVDLEELKDSPSDELPGFNERLKAWLPTMIEHRCSEGVRGGFFERLRRGTWQAHILEHVSLELQTLAGSEVGFGRARETSEDGVYKVAIEYEEEDLARACLESGKALLDAAVHDKPFDVEAEIHRLRDVAYMARLGPSTMAVVDAAKARGIPVMRLNTDSLIQFGHGVHRKRYLTGETEHTGALAEFVAQDKQLTRTMLMAAGVPVPEGRPVADAEDAWAAALEIGPPVVVKPRDANHSRGVATNLTTRQQVLDAYEVARKEGKSVLVERYAHGSDHRVLVVAGKVVAAARRDPAHVVGDGVSTVAQLAARVNEDPLRGDGFHTPLTRLKFEPVSLGVLADQGYTPESTPPVGVRVLIRRNVNYCDGGTATDRTASLHPETAMWAVEAAHVVGLDVAGIDLLAEDLTRPLREQGGAIVEVNAGPGLMMHLPPSASPNPVGVAIVESLFPDGADGRIPILGITGVNGKTTVTRLIAHILGKAGLSVGMTCTDGVYLGDRRLVAGDCSGPKSARDVLTNPRVEAAVLEAARGGILREGLGFDRCDVAVVTNIGEGDHLGLHDILTPERLAYVKRTLVDALGPGGVAVLNAADPLVAEMADHCRGDVLFFARDAGQPTLAAHRDKGGRVAFTREGAIILAREGREEPPLPLAEIPLTRGGRVGFQVENALAGAAACWALGTSFEVIRDGLASFDGGKEQAPGRFNVVEKDGSTLILDYGHNPSALLALVESLAEFPASRRVATYSAEGDRPDDAIIRQGAILGDAFDRVVLYEDASRRRGRAPGAILGLLRRGLAEGRRVAETAEIEGEAAAVEAALRDIRPGDLTLIQIDAIEPGLELAGRAGMSP